MSRSIFFCFLLFTKTSNYKNVLLHLVKKISTKDTSKMGQEEEQFFTGIGVDRPPECDDVQELRASIFCVKFMPFHLTMFLQ